jgi:hypothetical protein
MFQYFQDLPYNYNFFTLVDEAFFFFEAIG